MVVLMSHVSFTPLRFKIQRMEFYRACSREAVLTAFRSSLVVTATETQVDSGGAEVQMSLIPFQPENSHLKGLLYKAQPTNRWL